MLHFLNGTIDIKNAEDRLDVLQGLVTTFHRVAEVSFILMIAAVIGKVGLSNQLVEAEPSVATVLFALSIVFMFIAVVGYTVTREYTRGRLPEYLKLWISA